MRTSERPSRSPAPIAAGVIAAGEGTRLRKAFPGMPKPLVPVAGVPLCRRIVGALRRAGATGVTAIVNTTGAPGIRACLESAFPSVPLKLIVRDTGSSWESFRIVASSLSGRRDILMSTTDALIPPRRIALFVREMRRRRARLGLGLTDCVDDEKPLWADLAEDGTITALGPSCRQRRYATAGLYYLRGTQARRLPSARAFPSLRRFWTKEVARGGVAGAPLGRTLDVDRPQDVKDASRAIRAAERARGRRASASPFPRAKAKPSRAGSRERTLRVREQVVLAMER